MTGTTADLLRAARERTFVGRAAEIAAFEAMLAGQSPFQLLWLTGPGGIGKSTLMQRLADLAQDAGAGVAMVSASSLVPAPGTVRDIIDRRVRGAGPGRVALLIDAVDDLAPLDDWMRTELLPDLPDRVLIVLASRRPPGSRWRTDLGWSQQMAVLTLGDLDSEEVGEYLVRRGQSGALTGEVVAATQGHPLALALVTDMLDRGSGWSPGSWTTARGEPEVIQALLERFLDDIPDPVRRRALSVLGLARTTTLSLVRATVTADGADECFTWLAGQSFTELTDEGIVPHELARRVLEEDLRWRDPPAWRELQERIRADGKLRLLSLTGPAQQQAATDLLWFHRRSPLLAPHWTAEDGRAVWVDQASDADLEPILDLVERHEGPESRAIHRAWWEVQPRAFHVVRALGEPVRGFVVNLRLPGPGTAQPQQQADVGAPVPEPAENGAHGSPAAAPGASSADPPGVTQHSPTPVSDPVMDAAWNLACGRGRLRPGEHARVIRSWIGVDGYHLPTATNRAFTAAVTRQALTEPGLAATVAYAVGATLWTPLYGYADYARAEVGDATVGGRRFVAYLHDWRVCPPLEWLELMDARLADPASGGPEAATGAIQQAQRHLTGAHASLSEQEFAAAVREAFRNALDPHALTRSPLLRARVTRTAAQSGGHPNADDLRRLLAAEVTALRERPRRETAARAIELTYLTKTRTQEAAAARMSLPFSTYRRHLAAGLAEITQALWQRELGP